MVGRLLRAGLAALLLTLAVAVGAPSASAVGDEYIDVDLASVSVTTLDVSDPTQTVVLSGTITNTSTVDVTWLSVDIWRLTEPVTSTAELETVTDDPDSLPLTGRLLEEELGNTLVLRTTDPFRPGERAQFTVRATIEQLGFTRDDTAYLVGVQARGLPTDGDKRTLGRDQAVLPATQTPAESSALVILDAAPSWLPDGTFLDDSLHTALDQRLETLLASAERPGVQAAIDPALYSAVGRLAVPHQVGDDERPGSGIAVRWLERVDALGEEGRLWRLPYGNPDFSAAEASGRLQQVLAWARAAAPAGMEEVPSVTVLDGDPSNDLIARLSEFDTVVIRNATGASPGPPQLIGAARDRYSALPESLRLPRRIAEELLAESPPLYLIDTPQAADDDRELGAWRRHVPIAVEEPLPLRWPDGPAATPRTQVSAALDAAAARAVLLRDLTGTGEGLPDSNRLGALAFSKSFVDEGAAVRFIEAAIPAEQDTGSVQLSAAQSFVMGARTNTFPATLTNELAVPVVVRLEFTSESPQRIRVPATEFVTVGPGESQTVEISPEASSNGVSLVRARIVTRGGAVIGAPQTIEITATDLGRVGWIIIVVSGAVVVGGTALRIRGVRRQRAKEERESGQ